MVSTHQAATFFAASVAFFSAASAAVLPAASAVLRSSRDVLLVSLRRVFHFSTDDSEAASRVKDVNRGLSVFAISDFMYIFSRFWIYLFQSSVVFPDKIDPDVSDLGLDADDSKTREDVIEEIKRKLAHLDFNHLHAVESTRRRLVRRASSVAANCDNSYCQIVLKMTINGPVRFLGPCYHFRYLVSFVMRYLVSFVMFRL
ncbi:hypothetical protein L596_003629 [Steinernema carpocapsae]|uniref:Uncharacterized protein n=1 Tax=Steinernema carpocapsae TaxID=34508 RepID=A0A4U8UX70_STECR|nr:hypothetical protein L596_003629 [Steinernema carpocapsae]